MTQPSCVTNAARCDTDETNEIADESGSNAIRSACDTGEGGRVKESGPRACDVRAQHQAARALAQSDAGTRVRADGGRR
ncbi:MAG: hypothetical protein HQRvContig05_15 [Haloquadratum phage sp.]|nr:MAG: hypothetical protein HQRvContig05_15 [Haloquadratum phage sp.]